MLRGLIGIDTRERSVNMQLGCLFEQIDVPPKLYDFICVCSQRLLVH